MRFFPQNMKEDKYQPSIVITDFKIMNKSVPVGRQENGRIILKEHISKTRVIKLSHKDAVITFEFAALSFIAPEKNQNTYRMDGIEKEWGEFELWFQEVHSEFYTRLQENHPGLSQREMKICAFLKLNLSTKEIASITNLTVKTIEVYRSNLRKKLAVPTSENLVKFINDINLEAKPFDSAQDNEFNVQTKPRFAYAPDPHTFYPRTFTRLLKKISVSICEDLWLK